MKQFYLWLALLITADLTHPQAMQAQYCPGTSTGTCYRYLGRVQIGSIDQTTFCADYTSFYRNYTSLSTTVTQSTPQPITLTNPSSWTTHYRVYVDWNQDFDFTDPGELALTGSAGAGGSFTGNITAPITASLGPTRIRIRADYYNAFPGGSCAGGGEVECQDYTLSVAAAPPGTLSGIVNQYAAVSAICGNQFYVSTTAGFSVGDKVLVIQMRGAAINSTNSAAFGDITSLGGAGLYEFLEIQSISGSIITTTFHPQFPYDVTGQVQMVRVMQVADPVATVGATGVTCPAWNGSVGGVVVIEAAHTLRLEGNITVSGMGFRGGAPDNAGWACNYAISHSYVYPHGSQLSAPKGEGIGSQFITSLTLEGRGAPANGGGAGNNVNAGGGGGGNGGTGGLGGWQWVSCADPTPAATQGQPGKSLSAHYSNALNRVFMGGGGGAGHAGANVLGGGAGANGGGIVILRCATLEGAGGSILARGHNAVNVSGQWAGGGGGAGGTVLLEYASATGTLTVDASGGNGGPAYWPNQLGPGGGGGGGVLWVAGSTLPPNLSFVGAGGLHSTWNNGGTVAWGAENGQPGPAPLTHLATPPMSTLTSSPTVWPAQSWSGAFSSSWFNPCNWSPAGVPAPTTDVYIPDVTNDPVIDAPLATCGGILLSADAQLTVLSTHTLEVHGDLDFDGTFTANQSTLRFAGALPQSASVLNPAANPFYNLEVAKATTQTIALGSNLNVTQSLTLTQGILATGAHTLHLANANPAALAGGSTNAYIRTDGAGGLDRRIDNQTGSYLFPVGGSGMGFQPIQISLNSNASSLGTRLMGRFLGATPTLPTGTFCTADFTSATALPGYSWDVSLSAGAPAGLAYSATVWAYGNPVVAGQKSLLCKTNDWAGTWNPNLGSCAVVSGAFTSIARDGFTGFSGFSILHTPLPLSIDKLRLEAQWLGPAALLGWRLAQGTQVHSFMLERSTDLLTWQRLTQLPGNVFAFADSAVPKSPRVYYRLVAEDADGGVLVSNTEELTQTQWAPSVVLYPNPAYSSFSLSFSQGAASLCTVSVYDAQSRLVYMQPIGADADSHTVTTAGWAPGVYFVRIEGTQLNESIRVLVLAP